MSRSPVRFAILGFGLHAVRRLLPSFPRAKDSVLVGMWRRNQAAAADDCRQHGIAHCFATKEELCASPDVDAVFITSPDAMHLEDVLLAVQHGKPVLCEKPLAMNAAEAEQMAQAAKAAGVVFGVAQNFRWNRSVNFIRERVAAGAVGTVQMAQAQFCYAAQHSARKWIADGSLAMGGPIGDVGVHSVDALRYIVQAEVESVSTLAEQDELSGDVEAYAAMQMRMKGGILAHVVANARTPYRTLIEVSGSEGLLSSEDGFTVDRPVEVVLRKGGKVVATNSFDNSDGYALMLDSFAAAVCGEGTFAATGEDGVRNMLVLDAAYKSWKSGRRESAE